MLEHKMVSKAIENAQNVEAHHFEMRKQILNIMMMKNSESSMASVRICTWENPEDGRCWMMLLIILWTSPSTIRGLNHGMET